MTAIGNQNKEHRSSEFTHQSVNEQLKIASESFLKVTDRLCALLIDRNRLNTADDTEEIGFGHDEAIASSSTVRFEIMLGEFSNLHQK